MLKNKLKEVKACTTCYRIACKCCNWIANEEDVFRIQNGLLTACPRCGWRPGDDVV